MEARHREGADGGGRPLQRLTPDGSRPLYLRVKDYILENIGAGDWDPRKRLPSENELVGQLGVSRMTVNRALRELAADGIVERRQGSGTFVAARKPPSAPLEIRNIAHDIQDRGHRHRCDVLRLHAVTTDAALTASFEFDAPRQVHRSLIVHYAEGAPAQIEDRYVNPDLVSGYLDQDFNGSTTCDYLVAAAPMSEVESVVSAIAADASTAKYLHVDFGTSCLLYLQRIWSRQSVAAVSRFTYAGDRQRLVSRRHLKPN